MVLLQCACYESDSIRSSLRHFDRSGGDILVGEGPCSSATCIVISMRDRNAARPIIELYFITLAAVLSAVTPILGLWGSIVWIPFADLVRRIGDLGSLLLSSPARQSVGQSKNTGTYLKTR